jgi:hypothetical protein
LKKTAETAACDLKNKSLLFRLENKVKFAKTYKKWILLGIPAAYLRLYTQQKLFYQKHHKVLFVWRTCAMTGLWEAMRARPCLQSHPLLQVRNLALPKIIHLTEYNPEISSSYMFPAKRIFAL